MKQPKASELVIGQNADQLDPSRKEIIFWEEGNPRCVVNLLKNAESFREKVLSIPPNLLAMSDHELEKHVDPSQIDQDLRQAFWDEYTAAIDTDSLMRVAAVYSRVCTREFFMRVTQDPKRMAYMLRPPREYSLRMKSLLDVGLRRIEEFLQLPVKKTVIVKGREVEVIDTKLVGEIVKITAMLDNRVKGAVAQKFVIDQTSKNLNMNVNKNYEPPKSMAEIEKQLKAINSEILELETPKSQPDEEILINGFKEENERELVEVTPTRSEKAGA